MRAWLVVIIFVSIILFNGCEIREHSENQDHTASIEEVQTVLRVYIVGEIPNAAIYEINRSFEEQHSGVTIQYDSVPTDLYESLIKTWFSSGDAPDVFFVWTGAKKDVFARLGYLMDLSEEPWVSRMMDGPMKISSYKDKVYALPLEQGSIGVLYNRKVFRDLGISVPSNWDEYIQACQILKDHGITPMVLGNRDLWVTQLISYAMAPSAIYQDDPSFDDSMLEGNASFVGSTWEQMMKDYVQLDSLGYFNEGYTETTYDQAVGLLSTEKAAMMVMGSWGIGPIRQANPNIDLGMFPLPYAEPDNDIWVSTGVNSSLAISKETNYPELAKAYLRHWASPVINRVYLEYTNNLPVFKDVHPDLDPAMEQLLPYLNTGTYPFLDQKWPPGVQEMMMAGIQRVLLEKGSEESIQSMLSNMDQAFQEGLRNMD